MTLPAVIRIFFALDLPPDTKKELGEVMASLKKQARTQGIRWTRPENLHVTLQFLAEVRSADLPALIDIVRSRMEGNKWHLNLTLGSLRLFPNPYRPRVIVLDVGPQAELAELASLIGGGIEAAQYETDSRPFKAHLTLGRIKQPHGTQLSFLARAVLPQWEGLPVKEVMLYRSEPQPEGSLYTIMEKIPL